MLQIPKNLESLLSRDVLSEYAETIPTRKSQQLQVYLDEASFFLSYIREKTGCAKNLRILEVGSGIGLLSLLMSEDDGEVVSVEPYSAGFEILEEFNSVILRSWLGRRDLPIFRSVYVQDLVAEQTRFDLVVALHVIEHVADWKVMIDSMVSLLTGSGKVVVVCPNYSFPYEQHLEIPIVLNKRFTWFLFGKRIKDSQKVDNIVEFWEQLSWPTSRQIGSFLRSRGLGFRFSRRLFQAYFVRLSDPRFLERKGTMFRGLSRFAPIARAISLVVPKQLLPLVELEIWRK